MKFSLFQNTNTSIPSLPNWIQKLTQKEKGNESKTANGGVWCFYSKCYIKTKISPAYDKALKTPPLRNSTAIATTTQTTTTTTQTTTTTTQISTSSGTFMTTSTNAPSTETPKTEKTTTTINTTIRASEKLRRKAAIQDIANVKDKKQALGFSDFNFLLHLLPMKMKHLLTDIDCGDKTCSLRHEVKRNCVIYLHSNNTNCNIPCKLDGCKTEVHRYMNCPIWDCISTTTTTSTTTISTTTGTETTTIPSYTTSSPQPCPPCPIVHSHVFISVLLNILLILGICSFLIYKNYQTIALYFRRCCDFCRRSQSRSQTPPPRRTSLLENDNRYFSVGSDVESNNDLDNIPLVPHSPNQSHGFSNIDLHAPLSSSTTSPISESVQTPLTTVTTTTLFRTTFQSAPRTNVYVRSYSTFKPEIVQRQKKTVSNSLERFEQETML